MLAALISFMIIAPAQAQSTIDKAVAALKDAPVYVATDAEEDSSSTTDELTRQLNDGDNIVIVMLPEGSGDHDQLAGEVNEATGRKHIIGLSVGDEATTVSTVMPQT